MRLRLFQLAMAILFVGQIALPTIAECMMDCSETTEHAHNAADSKLESDAADEDQPFSDHHHCGPTHRCACHAVHAMNRANGAELGPENQIPAYLDRSASLHSGPELDGPFQPPRA
jgi:ABC-type nickel/cobalt efflux system permease component RcnA